MITWIKQGTFSFALLAYFVYTVHTGTWLVYTIVNVFLFLQKHEWQQVLCKGFD